MSINITVSDSFLFTDDLHAVLSTTELRLQKLPLQFAYTDTSTFKLQKLPLQLAYTDNSALKLQKLILLVAYTAPVIVDIDIDLVDSTILSDLLEYVPTIELYTADYYDYSDSGDNFLAVALFKEAEDVTPWGEDAPNIFDDVSTGLGILVDTSDEYTTQDQLQILLQYLINLESQFDTADSINLLNNIKLKLSDVRLYSDFNSLRNHLYKAISDTKVYYDSINYNTSNLFKDLLNFQDQVSTQLSTSLLLTLTFSDFIYLADSFTEHIIYSDDYIRRYLNDRLLKQGDILISFEESLSKLDDLHMALV